MEFRSNHSRKILVIVGLLACLLVSLYVVSNRQHPNLNQGGNSGNPSVEPDSPAKEEPRHSENFLRKDRKSEGGSTKRAVSILRAELVDALNDKEAKRSRLLLEKEGGAAISYLVGVEPPSAEEVKEIRQIVSNLQKESADRGEETEEFDKWIGKKIDEYDAFGTKGQRVIIIRIPEDANARMSAVGYPSSDFDTEVSRLDAGGKFNVEGLTIYFTDPAENLPRFKALIK